MYLTGDVDIVSGAGVSLRCSGGGPIHGEAGCVAGSVANAAVSLLLPDTVGVLLAGQMVAS